VFYSADSVEKYSTYFKKIQALFFDNFGKRMYARIFSGSPNLCLKGSGKKKLLRGIHEMV